MRSSSGKHYIALDHVRAVAAFMVFTWHFTHAAGGYPVPFDDTPGLIPFALLDEGHTGVALFMTLSGYLFAKLLNNSEINYKMFLLNRVLRLFPLLTVVIFAVGLQKWLSGDGLYAYANQILSGVYKPTLPNGGWSITAELHFYLMIPLLLFLIKKSGLMSLWIIAIAVTIRFCFYIMEGEVQSLAYWTIIGRIDQFFLGMIIYSYRSHLAGRHVVAVSALSLFAMIYWTFDLHGGFYGLPTYPSPSSLWIYLPTIEGVAYAVLIAWYDNSFSPPQSGVSKIIGRMGEYSYSIYLLHIFLVFQAAKFIHEHIMDISDFYVACMWSIIVFVAMLPLGYLSYRYIESPFLKLRKPYLSDRHTTQNSDCVIPKRPQHIT